MFKFKKIVILVFIFNLFFVSCGNNIQEKADISKGNRTKYNFNPDWKFIKENPKNAQDINFDDTSWSIVSTPHTFNDTDTFDDLSIGKHIGEKKHFRGTVWYRKHFKISKEDANKKVYIEFESVRQIADVYINGKHLGTNKTGFIPFGYDLTPHLHFGDKENIIAVKANNDRGEHFRDNFPLVWHHEHWHPNHGGIYRNVFLHVMDPVHITLPLYDNLKTVGTYVYASNISEKSAAITISAETINESEIDKEITFEAKIVDAKGYEVSSTTKTETLKAGEKFTFSTVNKVVKPNLWYTRKPYMYKVVTALKVDKKVVDAYTTPLGIRTFNFNKDTGFHNNGEYAKLHGWGQKPTAAWAGLGAALPDWLKEYTFRLMDEAGGNFIRWGHCAGSPAEIAMGDKYGFVTLMPGVSGESEDEGETWDIRIAAFRDMIVYYRNHPSIFVWEGGNWAESAPHYEEILEVINTYDPHGKRLMGNRRADVKTDSEKYISVEVGTEGWQREYAHLPLIESEYLRDEGPRRIWDKFSSDDNFWSHPNLSRNVYKIGSEVFAVHQVEDWWEKIGKKSYHSGGANWVFTDGTHGGRNPTEVTRASGEVDAVRLPKEAFYATKAMWRPEAQIHVIGHWNYAKDTQKTMYVVSNCTKVKLYINGNLIGADEKADSGYLFKFPKIKFEAGEIKVEGYLNDKLLVSQTKKTIGDPVAIKLTSTVGPKGWFADGADIAFIDFEIVDKNGDRHPLSTNKVDFTISGPGVWRGGYNSGKANSTNNLFLNAEAGINRVAIRSMLQVGDVKITATTKGLQPASIRITSKPVAINNGLSKVLPQVYEVNTEIEEPLPIHTPKTEPYNAEKQNRSDLFTKFSYTGNGKAMLRANVHFGKKAYIDLEYNYTRIPRYLVGGEYIRMPNSDGKYWARDQLQFIAGANMEIYVTHDDSVQRPNFLRKDFTDTGDDLILGGITMSIFKRIAKKGESIIMAGNSDGDVPEKSRMYTVIGKRIK